VAVCLHIVATCIVQQCSAALPIVPKPVQTVPNRNHLPLPAIEPRTHDSSPRISRTTRRSAGSIPKVNAVCFTFKIIPWADTFYPSFCRVLQWIVRRRCVSVYMWVCECVYVSVCVCMWVCVCECVCVCLFSTAKILLIITEFVFVPYFNDLPHVPNRTRQNNNIFLLFILTYCYVVMLVTMVWLTYTQTFCSKTTLASRSRINQMSTQYQTHCN